MEVQFTINGKEYSVSSSNLSLDTSLNTFIRDHANLRGTKFMCLEGGCGACIVTVKGFHPVSNEYEAWGINSCLTSVFSCHGWDITTIEGIGSKNNGYHTIQQRIVKLNGIQCGYCTPGMIMNMHSLVEKKHGNLTMEEIENSFGGNICRCTGYRPILDAFKSVAVDADLKLKEACKDIEDLKVCPKTGNECSGKCKQVNNTKKGLHLTFADGREWHKVFNLNDIFVILEKSGDRPYMLVAGNTAHGVYRRNTNLQVFIDIKGVEELRAHSIGSETIELGGSVSLTEAMEVFEKAAKLKQEFEYVRHLIKHIDLIANVPVRNAGTLAGNIATKNAYKEFPSDLFVIFETVGAKVVVAESGGKITSLSFVEFQNTDLKKKVVLKFVFPAIAVTNVLRTYKIMPRAQNADAYVNAGFLVELDGGLVKNANLCFGGINPNFTHAVQAETYLIGKDLYSNETLQAVLHKLESEITPDWIQPAGHPDYRKNLATSLFYKFVLNTAPNDKVNAIVKSGGDILKRPISSGTQNFTTKEENYPINKPIPRVDGFVQSGGETQYANDLPRQPGELWAAFVVARKANGKLKEINADAALAVPGVVAFFSAKDLPGENNFAPAAYGFFEEVEEIFASEVIAFNGQPVGIIVAETNALAHSVVDLVKLTYEPETASEGIYTTIEEVIKANATSRIRPSPFAHKSTAYGTSDVAKTIKSKGRFGSQYHYTMEPQTCIALPNEEGLVIYAAAQWIDLTQGAISNSLKIPMNKIKVEVRRLGGGYGGKISRNNQVACAAALAAYKLNVPVRFVLSIEENMETVGKRDPTYFEYEVDVDESGKVQKLTNNYYQDHGYNVNEPVELNTSVFAKNCYVADAWDINGKVVTTHTPGNTWCRAPGSTEGVAMCETIMEHIAKELGKDAIDVRLANIADVNPMKEIFTGFLETIEYRQRKLDIDAFNLANRWTKRGIAVVPLEYPVHYFGTYSAYVTIYQNDGTVAISHGGIEMGQGINTKATQVAAQVLNVPIDKVIVKPSDSFIGANNMVSGGSITSESVCLAVLKACEELNERLAPIREELKDSPWEIITRKANEKQIDLTAKYLYKSNGMANYVVYAVAATEVEVDLLTGNHLIKRVDILEDAGESISPLMDIGQIEGAFIMGMGYWLTEKISYNSDGLLLNNRTWNYKPPGAKDIPIDFRISFVKNSKNESFVLRSKATGEPPLCASIVVLLAVRNAINSARSDAGLPDDWLEVSAPLTAEDIFLLAGNKHDQYTL